MKLEFFVTFNEESYHLTDNEDVSALIEALIYSGHIDSFDEWLDCEYCASEILELLNNKNLAEELQEAYKDYQVSQLQFFILKDNSLQFEIERLD